MDMFMHLRIAKKLKQTIEKEYNIKLNTLSFLIGNIKPDLSPKYINIPHCKKDAFGFIQNEIQTLLNTKIFEHKSCSSNFSERLGIMTHYLSDFFCNAHSEYYEGSMLEHYLYELQMVFSYIKEYREISKVLESRNITVNYNVASISRHIENLHKKYSCECRIQSPADDLKYSFTACLSLCFSILCLCIVNEEITPSSALLFHKS